MDCIDSGVNSVFLNLSSVYVLQNLIGGKKLEMQLFHV